MLSALKADNLDSRLAEALPWVLLKHSRSGLGVDGPRSEGK